MSDVVAYIDGGSHGSPGPAGIGVVIRHAGGERVEISEAIGFRDNNYAEYAALLAALRYAVQNRCTRIRVFSDSEVVVRQINGHYTCQSPALRQIYQLCRTLIGTLEAFNLSHIRREHNAEADELARLAICRAKLDKSAPKRAALAEAFAD